MSAISRNVDAWPTWKKWAVGIAVGVLIHFVFDRPHAHTTKAPTPATATMTINGKQVGT